MFVEMKPEGEVQKTNGRKKTEPWRKCLLDAAQYIREHGWCQHALFEHDGRACFVGAVTGVTRRRLVAYAAISRAEIGLSGCDIVDWNNAPGRTKEEVIDRMERAARS